MLKYIHQFVQTFLKEASKSRPKSRKSSRSSINLPKVNSKVKPEILAIDFNNEKPDADCSKEILELKRTYSLLMKKFVNPKLDLMTNSKRSSDLNILNLKAKQELIVSILNRIFYESTVQQKQELSKELANLDLEEPSIGWTGQRTSKLAANPMVETSSKSNRISSESFSFPETREELPKKNIRQTDKFLKHRLKSVNLKDQKVETKQNVKPITKNVIGPDLAVNEDSKEIKPQHVSVSEKTSGNENSEILKEKIIEYKKDDIISGKIDRSYLSENSRKVNLQSPLKIKLNYNAVNEKSNLHKERKDLTKYNQKKNLNIIRSITKVDKSKIAQSDPDYTKEKNNYSSKTVKSATSDQNKVVQKRTDKQQRGIKNEKPPVDRKNLDTGVSKNIEPQNENKHQGKHEQLTCSPVNPEEPLSDSKPNNSMLLQDTDKDVNKSDKPVNSPDENFDLGLSKSTSEERNNDIAMVDGENLTQQNIETLEKEQSQILLNKPEIKVCDASEQPQTHNIDNTDKSDDTLTKDETKNEKSKSSEESYWTVLSNKILKSSNDAQRFISNFEINKWKTKTMNTTHELTKDLMNEKQNSDEVTNESSKWENIICSNSADVNADTCVKLDPKITDSVNTQSLQNTEGKDHKDKKNRSTKTAELPQSSNKHLKTSKNILSSEPQVNNTYPDKSKSVDSLVSTKLNSTTNTIHSDRPNNTTTTHRFKTRKNNSNISLRNTKKNMRSNNETDSKDKVDILKAKITACMASKINNNQQKNEHLPKENASIANAKNIIPDEDRKIKKLLRQLKKIERIKSKQNVRPVHRIFIKPLNEGKLRKMSSQNLKTNKEENSPIKERRTKRIKSDQLTDVKTSDISNKEKPHLSQEVLSNSNTLGKKMSDINVVKNKLPVTPTELVNKSVNKVHINKVYSNIFPDENISKYEHSKEIDQSNTKSTSTTKIITEPDLIRVRKLHSRKEICKPTKLQMYGVKRSIYTHSIPKSKNSHNVFKSFIDENITEPNMASGSLMYVCGLMTNKQTNLRPITTHIRNIHTTRFRSKVKPLQRKKRTTITQASGRSKSVKSDSAICHETEETNSNTGMSKEIKLKNDTPQSVVNTFFQTRPKNSRKAERKVKEKESKHENQSKTSDKDNICTLKDTSNPSSLCSAKTKTDESTKDQLTKSEKNSSLLAIGDFKQDVLMDPNSNTTATQTDGMDIKNNDLNCDFQNIQSTQGIETTISKWKSRADRLENWKLEIEPNNTEENINDKEVKETKGLDNNYSSVQTENNLILEKDGGKKELLVDDTAKIIIQKEPPVDQEVKSNDKAYAALCSDKACDVEKKIKRKPESKFMKDTVSVLSPDNNTNNSDQNKNKNDGLLTIKNESTNDVDGNKNHPSNNKIREFESKLRVLENKLKTLEFKSNKEKTAESSSKPNAKKAADFVMSYHITNDENKTINKEEMKIPQPEGINSVNQNKNKITNLTSTVNNDIKVIKKDQNEPTKAHLFLKVKSLEQKLKNLETKVNGLKENPTTNKDLYKYFSYSRPLEEGSKPPNSTKPKPILNTNKLDEKKHCPNSGNIGDTGDLKIANKRNVEVKRTEKCKKSTLGYTKPEIYLKQYLTTKNNCTSQNKSEKERNISNEIRQLNNESDSPAPQSSGTGKELKLKSNNAKSTKVISGKIFKQKPLPKFIKPLEVGQHRKTISHVTNEIDNQQIKNPQEKSAHTLMSVTDGKGASTRKMNKVDKVTPKFLNQDIFRQNNQLASALNNNNITTVKTHKAKRLSKSSPSISIPVIQNGTNKTPPEKNVSPQKCSNSRDDAGEDGASIATKKSKRKSTPLNVGIKQFLKGNPNHQLKKSNSNFDSVIRKEEKPNTLHQGLLKSSKWLQSVGPSIQTKVPAMSGKRPKTPVLPKNLLSALKSACEKQDLNDKKEELKHDSDSTGSSKSVKDKTVSTPKGSSKRGIDKQIFNSFDYYKPKRRSYEVKHPIEKGNHRTTAIGKNQNILDKWYLKYPSEYSTFHCEHSSESNKNGRESNKFQKKESNKSALNYLITKKNSMTVKSTEKRNI